MTEGSGNAVQPTTSRADVTGAKAGLSGQVGATGGDAGVHVLHECLGEVLQKRAVEELYQRLG